jgi:hypothetical protein
MNLSYRLSQTSTWPLRSQDDGNGICSPSLAHIAVAILVVTPRSSVNFNLDIESNNFVKCRITLSGSLPFDNISSKSAAETK